jgi:hypothetical protein
MNDCPIKERKITRNADNTEYVKNTCSVPLPTPSLVRYNAA